MVSATTTDDGLKILDLFDLDKFWQVSDRDVGLW